MKYTLAQLRNPSSRLELKFEKFPPKSVYYQGHKSQQGRWRAVMHTRSGIAKPRVGFTYESYGYDAKHDAIAFDERDVTNPWYITIDALIQLGMVSDAEPRATEVQIPKKLSKIESTHLLLL